MKKKIIIVEDDNDLLETLGIILEDEGHSVWKFTSAKPVFKKIETIHPDTMVIDLMLPGINGDQLTDYIKSNNELNEIKVILISADARVAKRAREVRADYSLVKPFSFDRLLSMI